MPLLLTPDQELVQKVVHEFAEGQLAPEATAIDRESRFPRHHLPQMAELGLLGMLLPTDRGGAGADTVGFVVAVEEVARASGTDATLLVIQNAPLAAMLGALASPGQAARYLAPSLKGQSLGAVAVTEEAGGSSHTEFLTTATPRGDGYVLYGSKAFVAAGAQADYYLVLSQVPGSGPTFFIVDGDRPGIHFTAPESTLGLRGLPLCDMYLNRVEVGPESILGQPGQGLAALEEPLLLARLGVSAALVGLTQAALEQSIAFARRRVQFGQPIVQFGAIRGMIADVQAELEAARATVRGAAALRDSSKPYEEEVYEARLLSHRAAVRGTRAAHRIHGGAGFMRDLPLERVSRDVRSVMHLWDAQDITRSRLAAHLLE